MFSLHFVLSGWILKYYFSFIFSSHGKSFSNYSLKGTRDKMYFAHISFVLYTLFKKIVSSQSNWNSITSKYILLKVGKFDDVTYTILV